MTDNLNMVRSIVLKFTRDSGSSLYQELYSEGLLGLVEASRSYQPGTAKFTTYAYIRVQGAMLTFLRRKNSVIRRPRTMREEDGIPVIVPIDNGLTGEISATQERDFALAEYTVTMRALLSSKEYEMAMLKYEGYTQTEIGARLGLSENTVCRNMAVIRRKLTPLLMEHD